MRLLPLLLAILSASAQNKANLYEEELTTSMPIRERNWQQLENFANLPPTADSLRALFRSRIGYPPPGLAATAGPARFEKIGEDDIATYHRVWIPVAPNLETYGLYLVPKKAKLPAPLVISKHGGGGTPEMATFHGGTNYHDMVRGAAEKGYVVWAPLTVMYPFRDRDKGSPIPAEVRATLDAKLRAAGTSLMGLEVAKITKALDVILKRKEVDPKHVAMIGLSYGGYYTLYTAALEPRIHAAVASCSFRDEASTTKQEGRPVDLPGPELAALIAPRPLQIQAGINDKGLPIDPVRKAVERTRPFYDKVNASAALEFEAFDGGHEFRGEPCWRFLKKHLGR